MRLSPSVAALRSEFSRAIERHFVSSGQTVVFVARDRAHDILAWLKDDYSQVIVARDARDYMWVMARTPTIDQADYDALLARVRALGYPMDKVRKVPQQEPAARSGR